MKTFTLNGDNIHDIPSFYEEINRVFMSNTDWKLSQCLDALNDMFYGGYGEIKGDEEIVLIWKSFEKNREDLGYALTKKFYLDKLKSPGTFNEIFVCEKLTELKNGTGQTYFEIIIEIIDEHPNIKLVIQ